MATAAAEKMRASKSTDGAASSAISYESTCARCGGLMVSDFFMDLLNSTGELDFAAKRCVQCGEVVDPLIHRNRQLRQNSGTVRVAARISSSSRAMA